MRGGGGGVTKLDLSQAYQQLVLNPESRNLLTVNTHKRLFRPTRLQFCYGVFQREFENRVAHIPFVKVSSDDILISGNNGKDHLENLKTLLIIQGNGLHLRF